MFSPLFIIGFSLFLTGAIIFSLLHNWNFKKLSSKAKLRVEEIKQSSGFFQKYYWVIIIAGLPIFNTLIPNITGEYGISLALYIWCVGIILVVDSYKVNKIIEDAVISYKFIKTDRLINYLSFDLSIIVGFFLFFS